MKETCQVKDFRNGKTYSGELVTEIQIGKPVKVLLTGGKQELFIVSLQRYLKSGDRYWLVDKNGIKFTLNLI